MRCSNATATAPSTSIITLSIVELGLPCINALQCNCTYPSQNQHQCSLCISQFANIYTVGKFQGKEFHNYILIFSSMSHKLSSIAQCAMRNLQRACVVCFHLAKTSRLGDLRQVTFEPLGEWDFSLFKPLTEERKQIVIIYKRIQSKTFI